MARYVIRLAVAIECDDETAGSIELVGLSQSTAAAFGRVVGEGQYRGKDIVIKEVRSTGATRVR